MHWETSKTLASRSYIGLVLSQFLAAFNDQAIHFVAIFYASDMLVRFAHVHPYVDQKLVLAVVTACFISPFFLFSPIAGILADKFSKRTTIVLWKVSEVGITGLALLAFLMLHTIEWGWASPETIATISAVILVICVFAMGTHSAFFVPAKYGIMPELLHASVLSRGNGMLEGTSFVSQILGTAFGGWLYTSVKSEIDFEGNLHPGHEWVIGAVLLALAVVGVVFSLLVERIPAAAPQKRLTLNPFTPMVANFRILGRSRSLVLATIGIAFFTFMTLYMRQSLIFEGETSKELQQMRARLDELQRRDAARSELSRTPELDGEEEQLNQAVGASLVEPLAGVDSTLTKTQQSEARIAILVALIGLGVGIGCSLAGQVSGNRLELGLVPVGGFSLVVFTLVLAGVVGREVATIVTLIAIGVAAGLYIVPMYTLLQHRAPKESKGSMVATSNFLNVTGGLVAVVVFYFVTFGLQAIFGLSLTGVQAEASEAALASYIDQLQTAAQRIPAMLFVSASLITALILVLLCWQRPDFLLRGLSWFRITARRRLKAINADHLPANGPLIVATNCERLEQWMHLVAVLDRFTRFVPDVNAPQDDAFLATVSRRLGVSLETAEGASREDLIARSAATLRQGDLLAVHVTNGRAAAQGAALLHELQAIAPTSILPVYCGEYPAQPPGAKPIIGRMSVVVGEPLPPESSLAEIRDALTQLGR